MDVNASVHFLTLTDFVVRASIPVADARSGWQLLSVPSERQHLAPNFFCNNGQFVISIYLKSWKPAQHSCVAIQMDDPSAPTVACTPGVQATASLAPSKALECQSRAAVAPLPGTAFDCFLGAPVSLAIVALMCPYRPSHHRMHPESMWSNPI